ncbi:PD-(D/E)XK nuclease family protein [Caloramator sp. CAR-1]|uniref:PD-(D/E)XK nuclease family protein n=1 Tax=Caloramator sp. CAR-1 TaxID=3062777 RepID=UPI0026E1CF84|nr:PD-(D/E)XK nuclease family protein [Caloramator sp. CAR-1]MDO6355240.1 PD-(D/E)XK nuclease family protein [Caloramator sp. CAR-1]
MIKEAVNTIKKGKKVIYVAPSKELLDYVRDEIIKEVGALYNVEVITLDDLARGIAKEQLKTKRLIDIDAKIIIIKNAVEKLSNTLGFRCFKDVINKDGFIRSVANMIKLLKRENIFPNDLKEKINLIEDELLRFKIEDIYNIFDKYQEGLEKSNLVDMEDITKMAIKNCYDNPYFKDVATFILDGFVQINRLEGELIRKISKTYPYIDYIYHLPLNIPFVKEFAKKEIIYLLSDTKFRYIDEDYIRETYFKDLASYLFTYEDVKLDYKNITIFDASCIEDEVRQVAANIKEIVLYGEKLDNIAIVTNDLEEYKEYILDVFEEYEIPIELNRTQSLSKVPIIKTIFSFLKLYENLGKTYLETYLSSPYIKIQDRELLLWALKTFYRENDLEYLKVLKNEYSDKLYCFIENIQNQLSGFKKEATFMEYKNKLLKFIDQNKIRENIIYQYKNGKISNDILIRDLKAFLGFIDELNRLEEIYSLVEGKISFEEFLTILEEALKDTKVTIKKKNISGVKVLTPDVLRGTSYSAVFIIGLNEGIFPRLSLSSNLFTYEEKEYLEGKGIRLGNISFEMNRNKINFIMSMASSTNKLYLSFRTSGEDGEYLSKSQFLDEVIFVLGARDELKNKRKRSMRDRFEFENLYSKKEAINRAILKEDKEIESLVSGHKDKFEYIRHGINVEQLRNAPQYNNYDGLLNMEAADELINKDKFSTSKINVYLGCPFRYFMQEEIKLLEDKEDFAPYVIGNLFHEVMKEHYKRIYIDGVESDIDKVFDEVLNGKKISTDDIFVRAKIKEIKEMTKRFEELDREFIVSQKFKPVFLEQSFEYAFHLDDGLVVNFNGKIDRIDVRDDGGGYKEFIIYDYKTGSIYTLDDIINGDDIQLPIYYLAAEKVIKEKFKDENVKCLGLVYYDVKETFESNKLKRKGIIFEEYKKTIFNMPRDTKNIIKEERFELLIEYIKELVKRQIKDIRQGKFIIPAKCKYTYCYYKDICRYDRFRLKNKEW